MSANNSLGQKFNKMDLDQKEKLPVVYSFLEKAPLAQGMQFVKSNFHNCDALFCYESYKPISQIPLD